MQEYLIMIGYWVLDIREQCIRKKVNFEFRQCGTYTIKDGKKFKIQIRDLTKKAKLANINLSVIASYNFYILEEYVI